MSVVGGNGWKKPNTLTTKISARNFVKSYNAYNTASSASDWYMQVDESTDKNLRTLAKDYRRDECRGEYFRQQRVVVTLYFCINNMLDR